MPHIVLPVHGVPGMHRRAIVVRIVLALTMRDGKPVMEYGLFLNSSTDGVCGG
jgi:hypothetical protein